MSIFIKIKELVIVCKEVEDVIKENTKRWYGHTKRINKNKMVKGVFKSECVRKAGRHRKRWIDSEWNSKIQGCCCETSGGDRVWQECMGVEVGLLEGVLGALLGGKPRPW